MIVPGKRINQEIIKNANAPPSSEIMIQVIVIIIQNKNPIMQVPLTNLSNGFKFFNEIRL
jgi:hypothetical protein